MLILNNIKIKSQNKEMSKIITQYENKQDLYIEECPYCQSDELINWGTYQRGIYYIINKQLKYKRIVIQRVRCKHCNKTHALLPEGIVPYKKAILEVILHAIKNDEISENFNFSYETIENWKMIYRKIYFPYLKTMFPSIKEIINKILEEIFNTYEDFYKIYKKIIMMSHKGIFGMACF